MQPVTKRRTRRRNETGPQREVAYEFGSGTLRKGALSSVRSIPYLVRAAHAKGTLDGAYRQKNPYRLPRHRSISGLREEVARSLADLVEDLPETRPFVDAIVAHLKVVADVRAPLDEAYRAYLGMLDLLNQEVGGVGPSQSGQARVRVSGCRVMVELEIGDDDRPDSHGVGHELIDEEFVLQASRLCAARRQAGRRPTREEEVVEQLVEVERGRCLSGLQPRSSLPRTGSALRYDPVRAT